MKVSTKKRFLAWVIAFLMVVTYMPSVAYASDDVGAANGEAAVVEPASVTEQTEAGEEDIQPNSTETETEELYYDVILKGGDIYITNDKETAKNENGVVTITAPGKAADPTANIIKIYNQTDVAATLTFDYEASNYSDFSEGAPSGTYTETLAAGKEATLSITGLEAYSNHTAVLVMSNFDLVPVKETSEVGLVYEESLGSITAAGQAVKSGGKIDVAYETGVELVAAAETGAEFLGWVDQATNKILSKELTYTLKPIDKMSVEAVFVGESSQGYYMAGDKYLFTDLTAAADKAASLVDKTVVLMNDATLTGNHTIPVGVTFLVPFDDANTVYTEGKKAPEGDLGKHVSPTVYRELTMAKGASIEVNGAISVSAKHHAAVTGSNGGSPTGEIGQIVMEEGSDITVKKGGALYAYGFIIGDGNVEAESGAVVFEYFQFEDWRGGSASLGIAQDFDHGVFPISQYYVQNIEVPLKLHAGASEKVFTSVNIGGTTVIGAAVEFMGSSDAMFNLKEGYVIKSYDGSKDRLNIEAAGEMNLSPITARMGSNSVPTKEHELPINSNITVKINSGTYATITQDLALLPGAEIIISEGAECTLDEGVSIYVYDSEQWDGYCGTGNDKLVPINYAPSKTYNRTENDLVDAKVQVDGFMDASKGAIYSTVSLDDNGMVATGGANIFSEAKGKIKTTSGQQKLTYQFVQKDTTGEFVDIRIFPALLTNEDGSIMQTWDHGTVGTYEYINGQWVCDHTKTVTSETPAACTEPGVKTEKCDLDADYHTYEYEVEIPATGHDAEKAVKTSAVAATCTEAGNVAYWTCADCGTMFLDKDCTKVTTKEDVVIPMLTHDLKQHEAKDPTCTEIGWAAYVTCERDGCGYTTYKEEAALNHKTTHKEAVANTCTTDGNEEYWYCDRCKVYFKDADCTAKFAGEPIIKAAHDIEYFDATPATCTQAGQAAGGKCKNCDHTVDAGAIAPLGHIPEGHDAVPVTCTSDGCEAYWTCSREGCDMMFSDAECKNEIKSVPVIKTEGHKTTHHAAVGTTCTTDGNEEYWACGVCNKLFADEAYETELAKVPVIKTEGHKVTVTPAKTATCKEAGNKEYWTCSVCKKMFEDEDCDAEFMAVPVIEKLTHTETPIKAVAPTCTETGLTAGVKCSVCGDVLTAQIEVPSLGGHKWGEGIITSLPNVVVEQGTDKVIYTSGSRVFQCQNDGCKESQTETLDWGTIKTYEDFIKNIEILEDWAFDYAADNNIEDSAGLVIRYVRTGVDRYNSGSWQTMAGVDDLKFTKYVTEREIEVNDKAKTDNEKVNVTGLKNISNFTLPNGDYVDFGHMFGTIDISYTNKTSINHADVAGFFGDTTDLLTTADRFGVEGTVLEMVKDITENYFLKDVNWDDKFGKTDMLGDLDGYYINRELLLEDYEKGMLTDIMTAYFTKDLTEKQRAQYYMENRLQCGPSKAAVRAAVYTAYTGNSVITTLEGTRNFNTQGDALEDLRKAVCYTVADYICKLAGDYTADIKNECFTVTSEQFDTLAPGISQEIKTATMHIEKDGKQMEYNMKYYIATVDITRDDVDVYANYPTRPIEKIKDENGKEQYVWSRKTVLEQALAAQETYGNPESELYKENFNVIVSTNADGFDMTGDDRGEPGGLLIMDGEEIAPITKNGFFGILEDGTAVIGTAEEYNNIYRGQLKEAVGGFGSRLVKDGEIATTARGNFAPRTAVGITATGKVVMMVLDGRQEGGVSAGGDMMELAHIMLEAGCVDAINLDGGGSSTFVAKQPGDDEISLLNSPSDGYPRSLGSSLMAVSTAKSSTEFERADIKAPTNYMSVGSEMQMTANGVTSTGNPVDIPAGATWEVSDKNIASIDADGKITALKTGKVYVNLVLDKVTVGQKLITVVIPNKITFTKPTIDAVYDSSVKLPIKAYYEGKNVTINGGDFEFTLSNKDAGKIEGLEFVAGPASTGIRVVDVTAKVKGFDNVSAKATIRLYNQGENTFDFDKKTGGDRTFAWMRAVSNSKTSDNSTYYAEDSKKAMETEYIFAIDMEQIPIPEVLEELTDMLPGHDVEGACAWTYLCNLAQRLSDKSEVVATVKIDKNFELVDWEKIEVKNEYFKPAKDGITYDKDTNTLTLKLNWVRQYEPINIEMANPLCLVNGIKLVPKKGADYTSINAINEGSISYKVYMRASSLYSFASKPENQEKYGLLPYKFTYTDQNGIEQEEACGGFGATYVEFKDSYTLVSEKKGWTAEDGGWRYYKDGAPLKGINRIDEMVEGQLQSLYYDFGEEGIIKGNEKKTYSGIIVNEGIAGKKTYSYATFGKLTPGWVKIGEDYYYFDPTTMESVSGKKTMVITAAMDAIAGQGTPEMITETLTYEFDETGKLKNGVWFVNDEGKTYYYFGPGFTCREWGEKDGKKVYFTRQGHLARGVVLIREHSNRPAMYHIFDLESCEYVQKCEGFVEYKGYTYYYATEDEILSGKYPSDTLLNGKLTGMQLINGKYYLFSEKTGAQQKIADIKTVKLPSDRITYTGEVQKPEVQVIDAKGNTVDPAYYTVTYSSGCKNVGRYKATVKFSGPYAKTAAKSVYFTIVPKKPASAIARLATRTGGYDDAVVIWSKVSGASGYHVYYRTSATSKYTYLGRTTGTSATKSNLLDGTKYYFKIVPYYKSGNTRYSSLEGVFANVTTLKKVSTTPVIRKGTKSRVRWYNISGETGYQISRSKYKTGTNIVATYKTTTATFLDVKATKGITYYYKVRAFRDVKVGAKTIRVYAPWSNVRAFKR